MAAYLRALMILAIMPLSHGFPVRDRRQVPQGGAAGALPSDDDGFGRGTQGNMGANVQDETGDGFGGAEIRADTGGNRQGIMGGSRNGQDDTGDENAGGTENDNAKDNMDNNADGSENEGENADDDTGGLGNGNAGVGGDGGEGAENDENPGGGGANEGADAKNDTNGGDGSDATGGDDEDTDEGEGSDKGKGDQDTGQGAYSVGHKTIEILLILT